MANCDKTVEHEGHRWFRYNSITDEEERTYCDGTVARILYGIRSTFIHEHNEYQIDFLDPYNFVLKSIILSKSELEMLDVQKVLDKVNEPFLKIWKDEDNETL